MEKIYKTPPTWSPFEKPLEEVSFDDVQEFCQKQEPEGVKLDYKEEFSFKAKAWRKYFAAFSNTRGGVILIGVREDEKTGLPVEYEGIEVHKKKEIIEAIYEYAKGIDPRPSLKVVATNEVNGKVFLILQILEGDNPPYFTIDSGDLWVRTGNLSDPINASPEEVKRLFGKKRDAEELRNSYFAEASQVYYHALKRAWLEVDTSERETEHSLKGPMDAGASIFEVQVTPFYPLSSLMSRKEVTEAMSKIGVSLRYHTFPCTYRSDTIPNGLMWFTLSRARRELTCEQIYGNGLVSSFANVNRWDNGKGQKHIYVYDIVKHLFGTLLASGRFYKQAGYVGSVALRLKLNTEGSYLMSLKQDNFLSPELRRILLPAYEWEFVSDTDTLCDETRMKEYFFNLMEEILLSMGAEPISPLLHDAVLREI